ncbi:MAG: polysaccharide biosynthesis/export family protein [Proteobacteria bacterium]|nr:polysaccharide biosynthesis/export family protein [Pseudomonadota bacterium]
MTIYKRVRATLGSLILLVLITTCMATNGLAAAEKTDTPVAHSGAAHLYKVGPEDVLEISVWRNDDLSKVVTVRPDGVISLPLVGDISAAGLTPSELRDRIIDSLKEFQETVVVSVIVLEVNSVKVYILGEVIKPGSYTLKRRTSILQAIAMAGGFSQYASKNKMVLVREEGYGAKEAGKVRIRFDNLVKVGSKPNNQYILRPGDTIFVP